MPDRIRAEADSVAPSLLALKDRDDERSRVRLGPGWTESLRVCDIVIVAIDLVDCRVSETFSFSPRRWRVMLSDVVSDRVSVRVVVALCVAVGYDLDIVAASDFDQ